MHLRRAYEGPERFDCLSIGKVARWGQIRPQNALSLPQSPFDYEVVLHRSKTSAISVSSLRFTLPSAIHFGYGVAHRMSPGAMASSVDGISRPSVLAVLRLKTSSYLVGCPIGPSASRCCPYRGLQRRWTCPIGAVIGFPGPKQSILLNVAAPRASVGQMESTSHDPFATLAGCGCGRIGCTRHNLAGNGVCSGAGAAARERCPDLPFRQLSRRSARG